MSRLVLPSSGRLPAGSQIIAERTWYPSGTSGSTAAPAVTPEAQAPAVPPLSPFFLPRTSCWDTPIPVTDGRRVVAGRMIDLDQNRRDQGLSATTGLRYSKVSVQFSYGYALDPSKDATRHVRRAWANGRKFYDLDEGMTTAGWVPVTDWTFQVGDQTMPHPYFEALRSTAKAPCYQRQMVATFPDMSLEFFAEEVPTVSLEIWDDNTSTRPLVKDQLALLAERATLYEAGDLVFVGMDAVELTGAIFNENIDFKSLLPLYARFFGFDWYEAGGKLVFVKRAEADFTSDLSLDVSDLIPRGEEGTFRTNRRDEEELPAQIAVSYYDESIQFKPSIQQARLEQEPARVVQSRRQESLQVPFVVTAAEAMTAASHILDREAAQSVSHGPVNLAPSGITLEPADLVTITDGSHSFVMKLSGVTINSDNSVEFQAFGVATSVDYTREGYAGEPPGTPVYTQDITATLAATLPSLTASFATPAAAVTGNLAATLSRATAALTGTVTAPPVTGDLAASLPSYTASMAGTVASLTAWTPADLSPFAWYAPDDAATVTTVSGGVSQINDKSGNGRHLYQSTAGARPTLTAVNGKNCLNFDGTDDWMQTTGTTTLAQPFTVLFFIQPNSSFGAEDYGLLFDGGNYTGTRAWLFARNNNVSGRPSIFAGATNRDLGTPLAASTPYIFGVVYNSTTPRYIRNGGTAVPQDWPGDGGITTHIALGCPSSYDTELQLDSLVGDFVVVSGVVSDADMQKFMGYCAHKYGVTSILPSGHPYKTTPP